MEINILELSEYVLFIQLDPCYVWKGGMMGILPWVMVGGKNWSAGDGGRQKLVRGRWRAEKIGPRAMAGGKNWSAGRPYAAGNAIPPSFFAFEWRPFSCD